MENYVFKLNADIELNTFCNQNLNFNIFIDPCLFENKDLIKIFEGVLFFFEERRTAGNTIFFYYHHSLLHSFLNNMKKNIFVSNIFKTSILHRGMILFVRSPNSITPNLLIWDGLGKHGRNFIYDSKYFPDSYKKFWIINTFTETIYHSEFYHQQVLIDNLPF